MRGQHNKPDVTTHAWVIYKSGTFKHMYQGAYICIHVNIYICSCIYHVNVHKL